MFLTKSYLYLQLKLKEEREAKKATMDGRHEYILSTVADRLDMKLDDAEEFMLDDNQVIHYSCIICDTVLVAN